MPAKLACFSASFLSQTNLSDPSTNPSPPLHIGKLHIVVGIIVYSLLPAYISFFTFHPCPSLNIPQAVCFSLYSTSLNELSLQIDCF